MLEYHNKNANMLNASKIPETISTIIPSFFLKFTIKYQNLSLQK